MAKYKKLNFKNVQKKIDLFEKSFIDKKKSKIKIHAFETFKFRKP